MTVNGPSLCESRIVALPMVRVPGAVWNTVSGEIRPASSAAATVKGFSVDPGSKTSVRARFRARSLFYLSAVIWVVNWKVSECQYFTGLCI